MAYPASTCSVTTACGHYSCFADGEPIGEEGLYWLKVHVANCGDFEGADFIKVSKRPFAERVHWVEENLEKIKSTADEPLRELWWTKADKPFQFLAACFELSSALAQGLAFESRLPISFDGLQRLAASERDDARREDGEDGQSDAFGCPARHLRDGCRARAATY